MERTKINWINLIIVGIVGTLLFDITGLLMTGKWWDIPGLLGDKTGLGLGYGVMGHYANGIFLAILYAGIAPSLSGPNWLKAIIFVSVETIVLVWLFMFPLLGIGIAGMNLGYIMALVSMIRHWVYAIPLIFFLDENS